MVKVQCRRTWRSGWAAAVKQLGATAADIGDYAGYVRALEDRRQFFLSRGATSSEHSHLDAIAETLEAQKSPNSSSRRATNHPVMYGIACRLNCLSTDHSLSAASWPSSTVREVP